MVRAEGIEPSSQPWKGRITDLLDYARISLFLRPHLDLSGLSPHSHIPHIQYCPSHELGPQNWLLEWVVVERVNPCIRPLWPLVYSLWCETAYLVATWLLSRESNPDHEGMNLICYHCTTQLYYKARYVAFSIPKTDASKWVAVCAFSCINIISKFSKKVKFSGRSGENWTPELLIPNQAPYHLATPRGIL